MPNLVILWQALIQLHYVGLHLVCSCFHLLAMCLNKLLACICTVSYWDAIASSLMCIFGKPQLLLKCQCFVVISRHQYGLPSALVCVWLFCCVFV